MNGNSPLYRNTARGFLGGVAAGLGDYFSVDPTLLRLAFAALVFFTGGTFALVYLAMWIIIPAGSSSPSEPNRVIRDNLNEIGSKLRGFTTGASGNTTRIDPQSGPAQDGQTGYAPNSAPQQVAFASHRVGALPVILIALGAFFLLGNFGFRPMHIHFWWPIIPIVFGLVFLSRKR